MSDHNERMQVAHNHFGNARVQIARLPETNGTRAALALVDRGLHELALLPSFPPRQRGEAEIFFEGATLEAAVETILAAILPDHQVEPSTVAAAVSEMVGSYSDAELMMMSGQGNPGVKPQPPVKGFVSQAGLPMPSVRRIEQDPADPADDPR
jgi:hypothetical protein